MKSEILVDFHGFVGCAARSGGSGWFVFKGNVCCTNKNKNRPGQYLPKTGVTKSSLTFKHFIMPNLFYTEKEAVNRFPSPQFRENS